VNLSFGTNVREHGHSIGKLAGVEADRRTRTVRNIVISPDGIIGSNVERRPLGVVPADHFDGDILLHASTTTPEPLVPAERLLLTESTRLMRGGHRIGRLSGLELSPETGEIAAISGRQHWWTRRFHLKIAGLDFSVPGEIRVAGATSKAA
jgi:hypothetical protein